MASIVFRTDFQRYQGFCGGFSREKYGELLSSCTEDLPLSTGGLNSGCDRFRICSTDRFPVGIGILGQLVDADDCDGKSFPELSDRFVIGQTTGNAGEFVAVGPLIEGLKQCDEENQPGRHEKVCRLPAVAARMIGHENGKQSPDCSSLQWVTMKGESYEVQQQCCGKGKQRWLGNRSSIPCTARGCIPV